MLVLSDGAQRVKVGVYGAGAIGGYLGVRLSGAGIDVKLLGREVLVGAQRDAGGLEAVSPEATRKCELEVVTDPAKLADVDLCLVTVKTAALETAARELQAHLRPEAVVVPLQNGLFASERLTEGGLTRPQAPGLVVFNVVWSGSRFTRMTSGPIAIKAGRPEIEALAQAFRSSGEAFVAAKDIRALQMGKLLLNLNNGVCAATGLPLRSFLEHRSGRRAFAACIEEGLRVAKRAGRSVAGFGKLDPRLVLRVLPLPDALFFRIAKAMLTIDPAAKTSTLQDLERGRKTEVDALHGAIVALASAAGTEAPRNTWVVEKVHRLERGEERYATPDEVWAALRRR